LDAEPGAAGTAVVVAFPAAGAEVPASADPSLAVGAPAPAALDFFFLIFLVWKEWLVNIEKKLERRDLPGARPKRAGMSQRIQHPRIGSDTARAQAEQQTG